MGEVVEFNEKLSAAQTRAVLLLAEGSSPSEVAEELDIAGQTIYNWKSANKVFADQLDVLRRQIYADGLKQLRGLVGPASEALRGVLTEEGVPANAKVAAARVVFSAVRPDTGAFEIGISTTNTFSPADFELLRRLRYEG